MHQVIYFSDIPTLFFHTGTMAYCNISMLLPVTTRTQYQTNFAYNDSFTSFTLILPTASNPPGVFAVK
jgi:hypothetical protein